MRITVTAPSRPLLPEVAERVAGLVAERWGGAVELRFHPQCFLSEGHFAGPDRARAQAFAEAANDPGTDAVWFGRGGYGAARMVEAAMAALGPAAAGKQYLGYSDGGVLLAALHGAGIGRPAHGPLVDDVRREGGEAAVLRALSWLVEADPGALEAGLAEDPGPPLPFNLAIVTSLLGTPWEPEFDGRVLLLEEVAEPTYRTDRMLGQLFQHPGVRRAGGVRMGRFSQVQPNDPEFGRGEEAIVREWCGRAGVPFLGFADIGHDAGNKVVPFQAGEGGG
jgi:muramoyltetrapeptide carboxypeptidase